MLNFGEDIKLNQVESSYKLVRRGNMKLVYLYRLDPISFYSFFFSTQLNAGVKLSKTNRSLFCKIKLVSCKETMATGL